MEIDLKALREATGRVWKAWNEQRPAAVIDLHPLLKMADVVLTTPRSQGCRTHLSLRWEDSDICEALAGGLQSASPCEFVAVTIVEVSDGV